MTASNKAIVQCLFNDGLNKADLSTMATLQRDCILHLPPVGELRGQSLMQFFASLQAAFPDIQRTVDDQLTDDYQTVVARWTATGTHKGEFMGISPDW